MGRKANCDNQYAMNRGPWSAEEDKILMNDVQVHGERKVQQVTKEEGILLSPLQQDSSRESTPR